MKHSSSTILQQFETHSVSLLLKVAPICCSYSAMCVQQYATPAFHFAAHSERFPFCLGGEMVRQSMCGCQISIFLPAILGMLLKNLAIGFFTEWCSNLCLQICQNITNNAATKGCYLINVSEIKMQLPCIKSRLQAECRSLPHFHFSSAHVSDLLNMFCPKWAGFW